MQHYQSKNSNLPRCRPTTTKHAQVKGGQVRHQKCPGIAIYLTVHARSRCPSLSAVLRFYGEEPLTFYKLAGLIATRAMFARQHPLLDAPFGTTWAFDARHLE